MNNLKKWPFNEKLFIKALKMIFSIAPYQVCLLAFIIIIEGIVPAASIKISAHIIDNVAKPSMNSEPKSALFVLCIAWAAILLFRDLLGPITMMIQGNVADKAVFFINKTIMMKSNEFEGLKAFESPKLYDSLQVIQSQSYHKPLNLVVTIIGLGRDAVIAISCLILLSSVVSWIAAVSLICSCIHFRVFSLIQEKTWQESLGRSPRSRKMNYISSLFINPLAVKEARFFKFNEYLLKSYNSLFLEIYSNILKLRMKQIFWPILPFTISILGNLAAFIYVTDMAYNELITVGVVALTLQALVQLHISIASFGEQAGWIKGHLFFFEKLFEFLHYDGDLFPKLSGKITVISKPIEVEFKNVSFNYDDGSLGVTDISFRLNAGEKIAIVGENGAGKTTLIKLFCGLYAPSQGEILINGINLKQIDLKVWRENIAPVFQDFCSYHFTIEKNITLSDKEIDHAKLDLTIKQTGLNKTLENYPGLDQQLGKAFGGTDLSGGQWQKIALARAIYKDSEIYILDEPTASLDPLSEYDVYKQFAGISKGKTVLFVTHRLGSIVMADKILLLDKGNLIAEGSHVTLIHNSPLYKKMFDMQSNNYFELNRRKS